MCRNVRKEDILHAIKEKGLTTVAEIKAETGAGTLCGCCTDDIEEILKEELAKNKNL